MADCMQCHIGTRHYCAACTSAFARPQVEMVEAQRDEARADAARWKAEADRYREALAFYADEQNYHDGIPGEWVTYPGHPGSYTGFAETEFEGDHGERARAALSAGGGTDA